MKQLNPDTPYTTEAYARSFGFEEIGSAASGALHVHAEVRDMCAVNRCHAYGKNWACPPACGSLDDFARDIVLRTTAVIVQTVAALEDEFDIEGMREAGALHKKRFAAYAQAVRAAVQDAALPGSKPEPLFLSAGSCNVCPECTYPEASCRFPEQSLVSMEAAGLVVSEVCTAAGIPYYHGKGSISYTSCVLF